MNYKKEITQLKEQIMVAAILNQIKHSLAGIEYEESKKILNAVLKNKSAKIKVIIENETIAEYIFHK